jgi:hypothetical protein
MFGWEDVECPNCSETIGVHETWHPLNYIERNAEDDVPRSLFVIGNDRLLHSCPITTSGAR